MTTPPQSPAPRWFDSRAAIALALLATSLALALLLYLRNSRLTVPLVLGDEYYYSQQADPDYSRAKIRRTRQLELPRTLALELWDRWPTRDGDPYFVAKSANALLFAGILFPLFAVARRLGVRPGRALALALLGLAMPFHVYSAHFMPESAYALTFWCAIAALLRARARPSAAAFALCGLAAAVHYLVKPHGALLVAALTVAQLTAAVAERRTVGLGRGLAHGGALLASFLAAALAGGWLLSGRLVSLGLYDLVVRKLTDAPLGRGSGDLAGALAVASDHLLVLGGALSWLVPLLLWRAFAGGSTTAESRRFFALVSLYLAVQILAVAWYTQSHGEAGRIHLRYYDFVLPAFVLLLGAPWPATPGRLARWSCAAAGAAATAAFWLTRPRGIGAPLDLAFVADAPELVLLHAGPELAWLLAGLAVASGVAFVVSARRGIAAGLLFLAVSILATADLQRHQRERVTRRTEIWRNAGVFLQALVPQDWRSHGAVVVPELTWAFTTLFFFDGAPEVIVRPRGSGVNLERLSRRHAWVFVPPLSELVPRHAERFPRLESRHGTLVDLSEQGLLGLRPAGPEPAPNQGTPDR